jgi:AcrR family transcriptional regulator
MAAATSRRKSAEERREEILAIAIEHFAAPGFRGTSTAVIAREAGISQPYLFRHGRLGTDGRRRRCW